MISITKCFVLFLWIQTLNFVKSQDCTVQQFRSSNLYDENFDTTNLAQSYPLGKQVRVSCKVGYSGFFKITCTENGWTKAGSICKPRRCGHPGDAEFADFQLEDSDDFVFGSRVVYTCHKGYQMVSRKNFRRCTAQGWDGVIPTCEVQKCSVINVADNILVIGDAEDSNYGNVLRFSCKFPTQSLYGNAEIFCTEEGEWSNDPPECKAITCGKPQIEHGSVSGDAKIYNENEYLTFECNNGYKRAGERPSQCSKVGDRAQWSPTPACDAVSCRVTLLQGTQYDPPYRNTFTPGQTLTVTCGINQWISNKQTSSVVTRCKNDGGWTIDPVCHEFTCSRPQDRSMSSFYPDGGQAPRLGSTAWYNCKTGFRKPVNNGRATCTRDGWRPNPLCIEITCPRKEYPNAQIVGDIQSEYKLNEQVQYACNNGFEGTFTITCQEYRSGTWSQATASCREVFCAKSEIEDTTISPNKNWYKHNERVEYTCTNRKTLSRTCNSGAWTGPSVCSACPDPAIKNGFLTSSYLDKVYFACDDGYKPFTKGWWGEAICQDGRWSGLHDCIGDDECGKLPQIPNGKSSGTGLISCNEGYSAQIQQLNCEQGKWTSNGVALKQICQSTGDHCGPPPRAENAVVVEAYKKEYLANSVVTYQCRDKYRPEGENSLRCIDGQWENKKIVCIQYCEMLPNERQTMTFTAEKGTYVNGESIDYECAASEDKGTATCENGEWIKSVSCTERTCPEPDILFGFYTKSGELIFEAIIKYFCDEGYKLVGNSTNKCSTNGWANPHPVCEQITCDLGVTHPNLRLNPPPAENQPFTVGQTLRFTCTDDFILEGSPNINCEKTGVWSNEVPTCSEKCQVPEPPPGVNVDPLAGSRVAKGGKLTFSCRLRNHGIPKGKETVECLGNGKWSDDFPTCEVLPQHCEDPPTLPNGDTVEISKPQYNNNERVEYTCVRYYTMQGEPYMTCLNGEWHGEMRCLRPCTVNSALMNENNIQFRFKSDDKLYAPHGDGLTFACKGWTYHDRKLPMRSVCNDGVIHLPRCE